MIDLLGIIVFTIPLVSLFYYNYFFLYNSDIIKKYKIRNWIPQNEINHHINAINQRYFINLQLINFNQQELLDYSDLKYDYYDDDQPVTNTEKQIDKALKIIFSTTVSLSVELIILILCELIDFGNTVSILFHLIIDSLILLISVVIPFLVINLILNNSVHPLAASTTKKWMTAGIYLTWFVILNRFGNLASSLQGKGNGFNGSVISRDMLDLKITQVSLLGIVINSVLSGIGSATLIYRILLSFIAYRKGDQGDDPSREIKEIQLNNLISNYNNLTKILDRRQQELTEKSTKAGTVYTKPLFKLGSNYSFDDLGNYHNGSLSNKGSPHNRLGGIIHKVQSFASLNTLNTHDAEREEPGTSEIYELQREIRDLGKSKNDLYNRLTHYLYKFEEYHNQDTNSLGRAATKASDILNYGFAAYCVYRIINISLIKLPYYYLTEEVEDEESKDAIATTITKIILAMNPGIETAISERQIMNFTSFCISGSLFLLTFSNVLVTLKSFGRFFPIIINLSKLIKNWLKNLIICELLGMFIISTCLLIRTNLPSNLSFQISKILSLTGSNGDSETLTKKEIKFIDKLFDVIYLLACVGTLLQFWYKFSTNERKTEMVDEEEMIEDFNDLKEYKDYGDFKDHKDHKVL